MTLPGGIGEIQPIQIMKTPAFLGSYWHRQVYSRLSTDALNFPEVTSLHLPYPVTYPQCGGEVT